MDSKIERIRIAEIPSSVLEKIAKTLGWYLVGFTGIHQAGNVEEATLLGSGTLIEFDGVHGILTAQHVTAIFRNFENIGMILLPNEHRFFIERKYLLVEEISNTLEPSEGPDLSLVILPPNVVGTLKARKMFYGIVQRHEEVLREPINHEAGLWSVTGFPDEQTVKEESHRDHAYVQRYHGASFFTGIEKEFFVGEYDFLEIGVKYGIDNTTPGSFGGVSGGGLWQIRLTRTRETDLEIREKFLFGVAFYETEVRNGIRHIRCNGPRSIMKLIHKVRSTTLPKKA
jgi:hypothetical protein